MKMLMYEPLTRIHYLESISHLVLIDHCLSGAIYDNREPKGRNQWIIGANGDPAPTTGGGLRFIVLFRKTTPQGFRKEFIQLLMHAAKQSDVPVVPSHRILGTLKMRLPSGRKGRERLYSLVLNNETWSGLKEARQPFWTRPAPKWQRFNRALDNISHVVFDDSIPKGFVIGLTVPEDVGVIAYGEDGKNFLAGAMVVQRCVRGVQIVPEY